MGRCVSGNAARTWTSVLLGSVAMSAVSLAGAARGGVATQTVPPDRGSDPEEVVRLDFESAMKLGTANALRLFIRHNADHPLAEEARRVLHARFPDAAGDGDDVPCRNPE